jgi:hypothetical protein
MVNRGKELPHIQVHHVFVAPEIKSATVKRGMRAFTFTIGITIEDELPFK